MEQRTRGAWSTKKRDKDVPRGIRRHPKGGWRITFACGAGCMHKERTGPLKTEAIRLYHERRNRAVSEPGWCPRLEAEQGRAKARDDRLREEARISFADFADEYLSWSQTHKRSWKTDEGRIKILKAAFGGLKLDEITPAAVERFRDSLLGKRSHATANRYRVLLSGIFTRAVRHGRVAANPVKSVSKFKENNERVKYLMEAEEKAILDALPEAFRPHFLASIHTGLRWSEQMDLRWQDVDLLTGIITITRSKHGRSRTVPMNAVVRRQLVELGSRRQRPDDPSELVFWPQKKQADKFFPKAVEMAQRGLRAAGQDVGRLEGYVWHSNRHTFASRLAMKGVDLMTIKELGGWKTLAMVQRYAHLAPSHLQQAVERLVPVSEAELT